MVPACKRVGWRLPKRRERTALTGKITKHIPCCCRRGKGLACEIAKPEDGRVIGAGGCSWAGGRELSALLQFSPPPRSEEAVLGEGRQEEALAWALHGRSPRQTFTFLPCQFSGGLALQLGMVGDTRNSSLSGLTVLPRAA